MNPTSVEAGAEVAKSAMETVIAAMSDVFTLSGTVVTEITKQPILLFCLAAGLVPVGIGIFSRLKNAAGQAQEGRTKARPSIFLNKNAAITGGKFNLRGGSQGM